MQRACNYAVLADRSSTLFDFAFDKQRLRVTVNRLSRDECLQLAQRLLFKVWLFGVHAKAYIVLLSALSGNSDLDDSNSQALRS